MKDKTIDALLKEHLDDKGFTKKEISKILKNYKKGIKEIEEDEDEATLRHGTTCVGIIDKKRKKTIVEW